MGTFGWLNCGLECMILFGLVVYGMVRGWVSVGYGVVDRDWGLVSKVTHPCQVN